MSKYLTHTSRSSSLSLIYRCHRRFYSEKKSTINHYDALGINSNASTKEIKTAFYTLSKKHHPDMNPNDINAAQKFSTISNAYDILGDPVKRRDYDNELLARINYDDPYITYDRTSSYAQRARAHRPSAWKPSPSSSSGGFQGAENAFGSSRTTSYGTFDREQYDSAFGRYRGPTPTGRSNIYDFDEFYRAHYADFQNWTTSRKQAQEKMRQEQRDAEAKRRSQTNRSLASRFSSIVLWVSVGIVVILSTTALHDMHFREPTDEFQAKFYVISKKKSSNKHDDLSTKT